MDKLIELLREFDDENWNAVHIENYIYAQDYMIISKRFGFIIWLVDNDKIDLDAWEGNNVYSNLMVARDCNYSQYERMLMALSISDTPIEDLIRYLK